MTRSSAIRAIYRRKKARAGRAVLPALHPGGDEFSDQTELTRYDQWLPPLDAAIIERNEAFMQIKLPETVTQTVFITAHKSDIDGGHSIMICCTDMSNVSGDYVVLGTEEITLNVPQVNIINEKVDNLNKQKAKILFNSQEAIKSIDSEIQLLTRNI